jgi:hypothetical protein
MPLFSPDFVSIDGYPEIEPSLKLDFANARALDPRITFTRASTATYVGANGLIKTAGEDEPRFDHDPTTGESLGLLIEESRTNLIPHSQELNAATWNKYFGSSISANYAVAPDGTQTADRIIFDGSPSGQVTHNLSGLTIGQQYVFSAWVKSDGSSNSGCSLYVNGTSIQIIPTSEWQRIYVVRTAAGTNENPLFLCGAANSFLVWGVQYEAGSFPTSYIPTSGSTATREKDLPTIETSSIDFHDFSQGGEGTLLCEFRNDDSNGSDIAVSFSGDTHNGATFVGLGSDTNNNQFVRNRVNTTNTVLIGDTSATTTGYHLVAFGIGQSRSTIAVRNSTNGVQEDTSVSYDTTPYTKIIIGCDQIFTDNNTISGTIKKLFYYPTLLSDTQLQTLTQ